MSNFIKEVILQEQPPIIPLIVGSVPLRVQRTLTHSTPAMTQRHTLLSRPLSASFA
jgi:hypothetical protein